MKDIDTVIIGWFPLAVLDPQGGIGQPKHNWSLNFMVPARKKHILETYVISLGYRVKSEVAGWHHLSASSHTTLVHKSCCKAITITERLGRRSLTDFILDQPITALMNILTHDKLVCFFPKMITDHFAFRQHIREETIEKTLRKKGYTVLSPSLDRKQAGVAHKLRDGLLCARETGYGKMLTGGGKKEIMSTAHIFPFNLVCLGLMDGDTTQPSPTKPLTKRRRVPTIRIVTKKRACRIKREDEQEEMNVDK